MACCVVTVSHGLRVAIKTCWIVIVVALFYVLFLNGRNAIGSFTFVSLLEAEPAREWCPIPSPKLIGWTNISSLAMEVHRETQPFVQSDEMARVRDGGRYEPTECQSRNQVAVVVPYRNRADHLAVFLRYMHPFLQRQQLSYIIIVVEQSDNGSPFNRGMLMNIGFNEAQLMEKFQCFIFHDVDLLPENDANPYSCPEDGQPRQMSFSLDYLNHYKPTARNHFGGVTALSANDFRTLGGYSNAFWGWGGEDDELYNRVKSHNMTVTRAFDGQQPTSLFIPLARYKSLSHPKAQPNPDRKRLLKQASTGYKTIGGLASLKYKRLDRQLKPLYTHVLVDIHP